MNQELRVRKVSTYKAAPHPLYFFTSTGNQLYLGEPIQDGWDQAVGKLCITISLFSSCFHMRLPRAITTFNRDKSSLKNPLKGSSRSAITKQSIDIEKTVIIQIARESTCDLWVSISATPKKEKKPRVSKNAHLKTNFVLNKGEKLSMHGDWSGEIVQLSMKLYLVFMFLSVGFWVAGLGLPEGQNESRTPQDVADQYLLLLIMWNCLNNSNNNSVSYLTGCIRLVIALLLSDVMLLSWIMWSRIWVIIFCVMKSVAGFCPDGPIVFSMSIISQMWTITRARLLEIQKKNLIFKYNPPLPSHLPLPKGLVKG